MRMILFGFSRIVIGVDFFFANDRDWETQWASHRSIKVSIWPKKNCKTTLVKYVLECVLKNIRSLMLNVLEYAGVCAFGPECKRSAKYTGFWGDVEHGKKNLCEGKIIDYCSINNKSQNWLDTVRGKLSSTPLSCPQSVIAPSRSPPLRSKQRWSDDPLKAKFLNLSEQNAWKEWPLTPPPNVSDHYLSYSFLSNPCPQACKSLWVEGMKNNVACWCMGLVHPSMVEKW